MCSAKVGTIDDTNEFIMPLTTPKTNSEFDNLEKTAVKDFEQKSYKSPIVNPQAEYQKTKGYQPNETVKGYIDVPGNVKKIWKPDARINFQSGGLFGHCSNLNLITFMNNVDS